MSSKAKRIEEKAEAYGKMKKYTMYGTVIGSAIVTVGKLAQKTEEDLVKDFDMFSDNTNPLWNCKTIKEVCDYLIKFYDVADDYKNNIILVYDEDNVYTPIVTLEVNNIKVQALKELGYTSITEDNAAEVFEKIAEIQSRKFV